MYTFIQPHKNLTLKKRERKGNNTKKLLNSDINYEKFTVRDKNLLKSLCNKLNH